MNKQTRPCSAKYHNTQQRLNNILPHTFAETLPSQQYPNIRSTRQPILKQSSQELEPPEIQQSMSSQSKSKFLQKFQKIRCSRQGIHASLQKKIRVEEKKEDDFVTNKKRLYLQCKLNHVLQNTPAYDVSRQLQPEKLKKYRGQPHDLTSNRPQSGTLQYFRLPEVETNELIFKKQAESDKQDIGKIQKQAKYFERDKYLTAYWKRENTFVNLIQLQKNERLDFTHPNILSIHGQIKLKEVRFVICDEYKNSSLKNLLEEYGPFNEELSKRYLKQIALGLQHMHYKRRGHNRLTLKNILYNKNGQLLINPLKATSLPLTRQEINQTLHYHAPQSIIAKSLSKSIKNDVWALGCVAILMLTSTGLHKSDFHPYNWSKFTDPQTQTMVDNVKQLQKSYFRDPKPEEIFYRFKTNKIIALSQCARELIRSCLEVICQRRPTVESLLQHQFFQGI